MRWRLDRFRLCALTALALGTSPWEPRALATGQDAKPLASSDSDPKLEKRVEDLNKMIRQHLQAGRIAEAIPPAREKLDVLVRFRGKDHWQTGDARRELDTYQGLAARPRAVQDRFAEAIRDSARGFELDDRGQYAPALELEQKSLALLREILGEDHPDTATSYNNLAATLFAQGKHVEAEAMLRRALAIELKALGEDHPDTGISYNNLAAILLDQGKYPEAEVLVRRTLANKLKTLGEGHPSTADSYNNLAVTLQKQGKDAEAEAMHRRDLAIKLKTLDEGHPSTANSYNNLALTLRVQGKDAEAETMHRRAVAINLKVLGEAHPSTANSYNNLALALSAQRKHGEAEAMHRHALAIRLKALPEGHPSTANSYDNLAATLRNQGKDAEAEAMHRRALAINLKARGEDHPNTAIGYAHLASALEDQGKYAEAEAMNRRALAINLKARGEGHLETANSYRALASSLDLQGRHGEALPNWRLAAASYEQARSLGPKGLEAAIGQGSPFPGLAAALARAGQAREAWETWERGLARGIVDEVTMRAVRPLTAADRGREADLLGRGQAVDERINKLLAARALTQDQEKALGGLRQQASEVRRELLDLERQFEARYGALASRAATLDEARKAIPEGTAIVGWVDTESEHWACLLGHSGDPIWVRLAGSGKDRDWTKEEEGLSQGLQVELNPETTKGKAGPLAEALARQRLEPLKGHLAGLKRLVVVNSPGLAGVPVEVLMAVRPDPTWDGIVVSYVPSASMFAYLVGRPVPHDRPAKFLAVADPAYLEPKDDAPAPEPPGSGLAVARVTPNGNADLNGLREGDVLLSYGGTELKQAGDLKTIASDGPKSVAVRYWREGMAREAEVAAGPLGVTIDPRPASAFVRARRESAHVLLGMRGGARARLPGTRREVEAIVGLFPAGEASTILGPNACESTVQGLARSGKLKGYRYLHFATHGESDPRFAYRTALILAPDPDTSADPSALETDGTITAEQIARTWELDADLVVLSACESGLGRNAGAEGYLGFAQPLFARGARSLVLSQWKVDDDATALLMARFYRNLLGKREGLKAPLPKAEALAEAKRWLRGADRSEVGTALSALPRGTIVRREAVKSEPTAHPYEDPTYWAGFVLVGAPD
jgi:tetratricopeptide (TPR) repeat protein